MDRSRARERVTDYFGIAGDVPFVNVKVHLDNRLFVDPRAVRLSREPQPFADDANACTQDFFDLVASCVLSDDTLDHMRGEAALCRFKEPKETRLGYARSSFAGRGGAEGVGHDIWEALQTDLEALVRLGILKWIEDTPVFVRGVAEDITSDLVTRIIFRPLADYTKELTGEYPQLSMGPSGSITVERQYWNVESRRWDIGEFELPAVDGHPLVLVPKGWVSRNLMMNSTRFYETTLLSYVQEREAPRDPRTGKLLKTPKDVLKRRADLSRGAMTIARITLGAAPSADLLERFRAFVDDRREPIPDDKLDHYTR